MAETLEARDARRCPICGRVGRVEAQIRKGYSISDLARCLGMDRRRVGVLVGAGCFGKPERRGARRRVRFQAVLRFVLRCSTVDLTRVNQEWLKHLLFQRVG